METKTLYSTDLSSLLAHSLGEPQTLIHNVVKTFDSFILKEVLQGRSVSYLGIFDLLVDGTPVSVGTPIGYWSHLVAEELGLSYNRVWFMLNRYLELLEDELHKGNTVVVYGVARLTVSDKNKVVVRSSSRFREALLGSVRASVSPFWAYRFSYLA